jgi:hypothetical protein
MATGMSQLKSGYSESDFEQMLQNKTVGDDTWQKIALQHLIVGKILSGIIELKIKFSPGEISTYYKNHRDEFQKKEQLPFVFFSESLGLASGFRGAGGYRLFSAFGASYSRGKSHPSAGRQRLFTPA